MYTHIYSCLVTQSCLILCDLMDYSTPGFPVLHYLLEFAQTRPLSQWCYPIISSSIVPFSSCTPALSFPASGSFLISWLFTSGSQSIGASTSVLPVNIQGWFPLGLTGLTARDSQESSPTPQLESINSLVLSLAYSPTLISIHDDWKNHSFE